MNYSETTDAGLECRIHRRIRTLVVDDSPMALRAIRALLESRREIEVIGIANDGEEGVSQADDLQPDLVIMDLQMPRLDGLSATRLIRDRFIGIRVIVVTVNHGKEVRQQCLNSGADGFVAKDRMFQDLFAEIQRIFKASIVGFGMRLVTT